MIKIDDHMLHQSSTVRLLGITIVQTLTFKNHM